MHLYLNKRTHGQIEFGLIYGSLAVLLLCSASVLPVLDLAPGCVFRAMTGLPCPSCGATRSLVQLARGNIADAIALNPLAASLVILAILFFVFSVFTALFHLPRVRVVLTENEFRIVRAGLVIIFLMQWMYLIKVL